MSSADISDVNSLKKWLSTINNPKVKVVDNWLKTYKFDERLHSRFKQYFAMLDEVRGTDFAMTVDEIGSSTIILLPSCDGDGMCYVGEISVETDAGFVIMCTHVKKAKLYNPRLKNTLNSCTWHPRKT